MFRGIVPMQVTPFDDDGELDLASLSRILRFQLVCGISSVSALGMGGEFYKLSENEICQVIETVLSEAQGRAYAVVGVSAPSTEQAVRLARHAAALEADALLVLPPYAIRPSSSQLVEHYERIADCGVPIMIQDGSEELRATIPSDVLARICERVPSVRWIKVEDVTPNAKISLLLSRLPKEVELLSGSGGIAILDSYDRGASGCISGAATADVFHEIDGFYWRKDRTKAEECYFRILPLILLQCGSTEMFVAAEKRILFERALLASDRVRFPGYSLDDQEAAQITTHLQRLGLSERLEVLD
jgi:2-keto-3-deoxy-L-arabinonate dehydratase